MDINTKFDVGSKVQWKTVFDDAVQKGKVKAIRITARRGKTIIMYQVSDDWFLEGTLKERK